jgi:drug/metabolite transporter (DMT)-like permease
MTRGRAAAEMLFAAAIWGFGFIAAIWTLETWGPFWATTFRFVVASLFTLIIAAVFRFAKPGRPFALGSLMKTSFVPGILVGATLLLQTWGLAFTSATKSSFVTTLYVTIVPFFEWAVFRRNLRKPEWFGVAFAMFGVVLMTELSIAGVQWNVGDLLTVLCAITAAAQIVWIGNIQNKIQNAFEFNGAQSFWALLMCAVAAYFKEPMVWNQPSLQSWIGLFSLAIGSTAVAFALQIRAQRILSSTTASLFFLLEAPFAAVFAYLILAERLSIHQAMGGAIILIASLVTLFAFPQAPPPFPATAADSLESNASTCENRNL